MVQPLATGKNATMPNLNLLSPAKELHQLNTFNYGQVQKKPTDFNVVDRKKTL
jgi:hypothetical protein